MRSKIVFIRHGQSLGNANKAMYYLPDPAIVLTEKGALQAVEVMKQFPEILADINDFDGVFTTVLSSQFQRAKLTAQIVTCKTNLRNPLIYDARLNEAYFDHTNGKLTETRTEVKERVLSVLKQYPFNVIMFCHGQFMESIDHTKPRPLNCEVRIYDREDLINNYLCWNPKDTEELVH